MSNSDNKNMLNKNNSVRKNTAQNGSNVSIKSKNNTSQNKRPGTRQADSRKTASANNNSVNEISDSRASGNNSENLMKMQPGVTKIANIEGKVNGMFRTMGLYYGNVTNYKSEDGIPKRVGEEFYDRKLDEFLDSEEGKQYAVPTEEERIEAVAYVKNYINNTRKEAERRAIEEQVQARLREENEKRVAKLYGYADGDEEDENLYSDPEASDEDEMIDEQAESDLHEETEEEINDDEPDSEPQDEYEPEPEEIVPEKRVYTKPVTSHTRNEEIQFDSSDTVLPDSAFKEPEIVYKNSNNKALLIVMTVIMVLNLAATILMGVFGQTFTKQSLSNMNMGELNINGDVYTIPLSSIDVSDGETKTVFYALSTKNVDGEIITEAYPIGEWIIQGDGVVKGSSE